MTAIALTIAGSDSGGGAGIQADLKTFSALQVYGASAITAITAQNTCGVRAIHDVPAAMVTAQIEAVLDDLDVNAVKIGMLSQTQTILAVATALMRARQRPVLDPVMIATSGDALLAPDAITALITHLLPIAQIITPNLNEAARLLNTKPATSPAIMREQAEALSHMTTGAVLIKGGHGSTQICTDILYHQGQFSIFDYPRLPTRNTHGTGCTLAAAIAAYLAHGQTLPDAVALARRYLQTAIAHADTLHIGNGHGPVHHFATQWLS